MKPCEPLPGDTVQLIFRTGRYQVSKLLLWIDGEALDMTWDHHKNDFDYYTVRIKAGEESSRYYFEICAENELCYYGKKGLVFRREEITPFELIPGFCIPKWLRGALMYQVYVDRFYSADNENNIKDGEYVYYDLPVRYVKDWNEPPSTFDVGNFHGGDIAGVMKKIGYLRELGVEVIYLNPVFLSPSNHKYDIEDYDHVDPHIGVIVNEAEGRTGDENLRASDMLLAEFIEDAHRNGMKVILDGVFNHCSHFSKWMDVQGLYLDKDGNPTGAYKNPKSRFHDYFVFDDEECIEYESWWDNINLPKLNYEGSNELFEDIMRVAQKWVSPPFNADGWRLDVASDLGHSEEYNHFFWREFRKRVKAANPNAVIIAEHYDNAKPWLDGSQWDTVMNYRAFMDPVSWFFTGMEKHSDAYKPELQGNSEMFEAAMTGCGAEFPAQSLFCAMNQLDNHDHSRFITRTNHKVLRLTEDNSELAGEGLDYSVYKMAVVMQMIWPGAPCLYYGDEIALEGFTDPDSRRAFPWENGNKEMLSFYKDMIALRNSHSFIRNASNRIIFAKDGLLAFARFTEDEQLIAVFSMEDSPIEEELPVWVTGRAGYLPHDVLIRELYCVEGRSEFEKCLYTTDYGLLKLFVPPKSVMLFYGNSKNN